MLLELSDRTCQVFNNASRTNLGVVKFPFSDILSGHCSGELPIALVTWDITMMAHGAELSQSDMPEVIMIAEV
jgi:hypothetical protein